MTDPHHDSHDHSHAHGHDHSHDHDHAHDHGSELSEQQLRVRALESILVEKGYVDPAVLDQIVEAWVDADFHRALLKDASAAVTSLGHIGRSEHLIALENTPQRHNIVVCTLCSCYPTPVLGLPPVWYKSAAYRSRAVSDPRGVLRDFGVTLPEATEVRVWDSTAELRYLVVPMRPAGTEGWSEEHLATLVTRDSMIGTGFPIMDSRVTNVAR